MRRRGIAASAALVATLAAGCAATKSEPVAVAEPAFASPQEKLLFEAHRHALQHRPQDAIATVDRILASYGDPERKGLATRSYCARSLEETLYYMALAQRLEQNAVALTWAEAYYLKAYALIELGRLDEARRALGKALVLSPASSKYLAELAHAWQAEKDWNKSLELFAKAEEMARYSPPDLRIEEQTRALRGQGYSLVELGRLEEAEAKYRASLALDPGDFRSKREMEYINKGSEP